MSLSIAPKCVASTGDTFSRSVGECDPALPLLIPTKNVDFRNESNCFRNAQWSPDGTTLVTRSEDHRLRTFVLPTDLLQTTESPRSLTAYTTSRPIKSFATALYPHYQLSDPSTTLILQSEEHTPIRLVNTLQYDHCVATYPLVHKPTEAFLHAHSLTFESYGTHFVAGAIERFAVFDVNRTGEDPVTNIKTRSGRTTRRLFGEDGVGLKGLLTASAISVDGTLAIGTTFGEIGLWAASGMGEHIAAFSVAQYDQPELKGRGIMQLKWSSCGRYLLVAERLSEVLLVYDIRVTGQRLGWLQERKAKTTQPLYFDTANTSDGLDVWSGGTDGVVRVWKNVTSKEGPMEADALFEAHQDTVTSISFHHCQTVLATSSGQRLDPHDVVDNPNSDDSNPTSDSDSDSNDEGYLSNKGSTTMCNKPLVSENAVKIWTI